MTLADELSVLAAGSVIEHGLPENLYRDPHNVGTMALVGFPPANFVNGSLQRGAGELWCTTSLFAFLADVQFDRASSDVIVGFRPEQIRLSHSGSEPDGADGRALQFPASVVLREDLGGEDIVYLAASGEFLTMVDRDHHRGDDLDQLVTVSIFPHNLALFDAATGERVGRGARLPASSTSSNELSSPDSVVRHV
jgi:ABC-type sugar transport system ATPase subunit